MSSIEVTISSMLFTTVWRDSAVWFAISEPFSTASIVLLMSAAVFWEASADLEARFLTSSATTAKPFPASPARAASMAALSASMLVWNAISSMVLIISLISSVLWLISCIAASISFMRWLLRLASLPMEFMLVLASSASLAFFFICSEMSAMVAESSSIEPACSVEPAASDCAPTDT